MIRIREIKIDVKEKQDLSKNVAKILKIKEDDIVKISINKRSIDARKKPLIFYVYEVDVILKIKENKFINDKNIFKAKEEDFSLIVESPRLFKKRPIIVGSGPAALFCAYTMCLNGVKPIIIERGKKVEERKKDVLEFFKTGKLNENSNIQFGEGGAGTFSDGKLNTLVKHNSSQKKVFETFAECGADESIMYDAKPHIGTDVLETVIKNLREKLISLGTTFMFQTTLTDLIIENKQITKIEINNKDHLETDTLVLAIGHSARDTIKMLSNYLDMEQKPFAVGVRIQHPQEMISRNQYGESYKYLESASYKLTYRTKNGRSVYSFCMCPGGFVVNASSEKNRLAINGMSNFKRETKNANSALVVSVNSSDFGTNLFSGLEFQKELEEKSYKLGNGLIPVSLYKDYKENKVSNNFLEVEPLFKGKTCFANINEVFPKFINDSLKEAIEYFGTKIKGFNKDDAIIAAVESRTSSSIRILRNENLVSSVDGIYPCGEGAGYAGGITSAAMDGIKVALALLQEEANSKYDAEDLTVNFPDKLLEIMNSKDK